MKGARRPRIIPGGIRRAPGLLGALSRVAMDAARAETAVLRVLDSVCGSLAKYSFVIDGQLRRAGVAVRAEPFPPKWERRSPSWRVRPVRMNALR